MCGIVVKFESKIVYCVCLLWLMCISVYPCVRIVCQFAVLCCAVRTCFHCQVSPVEVEWRPGHLVPKIRTGKEPLLWLWPGPTCLCLWYECPLVCCYFYSFHIMYWQDWCCFLCEKYYTYFVNISSRQGKSTNLFSLNWCFNPAM